MKRITIWLFLLSTALLASTLEAQTTVVSGDGYVESTAGGFKFPDGSVQVTAAAANDMWLVKCFLVGLPLQPSDDRTLNCNAYTVGSPSFVGGQDVPPDYYFVVTDIFIAPDAGQDTEGINVVGIHVETDESLSTLVKFRSIDTTPMSEHYHSPILVLHPGYHLNAEAAWFNKHWNEVKVRGFLLPELHTYRP